MLDNSHVVKSYLLLAAGGPTPTVPGHANTYARLVGGTNSYEGRAEVFHNNVWGTICDDYWTPEDAAVICGMLGYSRYVKQISFVWHLRPFYIVTVYIYLPLINLLNVSTI